MWQRAPLSTAGITAAFIEGIVAEGGKLRDTYDDGRYLYLRSVLPFRFKVAARDKMHAGLALKSTGTELWLHPYLYRLVCRNGLIAASTMQSMRMDYDEFPEGKEGADELAFELPRAIRNCAREDFFREAARRLREARDVPTDWRTDRELKLLSMISGHPGSAPSRRLLNELRRRFEEHEERSIYGLVNATTSLARDVRDPALKWQLEVMGWKIASGELSAGAGIERRRQRARVCA